MNKNLIRALSLSLVLFVGFTAGCGAKKNEPAATKGTDAVVQAAETTKKVEKVKIKFWNHFATSKDLMTELVDNYNKTNQDGIEIELNVVADKYKDVLNMAFASGENPDVFTVTGPSLTKKVMETKWAELLDQFVTPDFKGKFNDGVWVEYNNVYGGQIFAVPDTASTYKMIYNKDLFKQAGLDPEQAPRTYAELREYAKKITAVGGGKVSGFGLPMGDGGYNMDVAILNGMGMNSIGSLRGYDYAKGTFDFSTYKPLLQLLIDLKNDGSMQEGQLLLNTDQGRAKFAEGLVGITGAASWDPATYATMDMKFEMGVAEFPTIDGTPKGKSNASIGSGYSMSASCADKDKAWKVIEFIFSKDYMGPMVKKNGWISLVKEVTANSEFKPDIKYFDKFLITENDAVWPPLVPGLKLQGDNVQNVFIQIATGQKNIDEGLADLTKRYNEAFEAGIAEGIFKKEDFTKADFDPLNIK